MGDSMVNWYYVVGSDRVGPVSEAALQVLFLNGEINTDTYVWKKGFANWERLKDVTELSFENKIENKEDNLEFETPAIEDEEIEKTKDEKLTFDWKTISQNDEIFFVKIGQDRKQLTDAMYGPYSQIEIREALTENRINLHSLIYSAGMNGWTKIIDTPMNVDYNEQLSLGGELAEVPLVLVFESSSTPMVTIIKEAGDKVAVLLGTGPFLELKNKTISGTLYLGNELKEKGVQVKVIDYDKKEQTIQCHFVDLNSDTQKIILNHGI